MSQKTSDPARMVFATWSDVPPILIKTFAKAELAQAFCEGFNFARAVNDSCEERFLDATAEAGGMKMALAVDETSF